MGQRGCVLFCIISEMFLNVLQTSKETTTLNGAVFTARKTLLLIGTVRQRFPLHARL